MGWKNWGSWKKGSSIGIIVLIVQIILGFILTFLSSLIFKGPPFSETALSIGNIIGIFIYPISIPFLFIANEQGLTGLIIFIGVVLGYYVIGGIIGWIVGMIRGES